MNKVSDITNKLSNKIDVQNIVKNVKSIITNKNMIPNSAQAGSVAEQFVDITKCLHTISELHTKQADELAKLDEMIGDLYNHLLNVDANQPATNENTSDVAIKETIDENTSETADIAKQNSSTEESLSTVSTSDENITASTEEK